MAEKSQHLIRSVFTTKTQTERDPVALVRELANDAHDQLLKRAEQTLRYFNEETPHKDRHYPTVHVAADVTVAGVECLIVFSAGIWPVAHLAKYGQDFGTDLSKVWKPEE